MFQFRIRTLFAFTVAAAALFGCLFALPSWLGCTALAAGTLLCLPLMAAGVAFTRGNWRAFWLGTASLCWVTLLANLFIVFLAISAAVSMFGEGDTGVWEEAVKFFDENGWFIKGMFLAHATLLLGAGGLSALVRAWSVRSEDRPRVFPPLPAREVSTVSARKMAIAWVLAFTLVAGVFGGTFALMQYESYFGIFLLWPATLMLYPCLSVTLWFGRGAQRAFAVGGMSAAMVTLVINMGLVLMASSMAISGADDGALFFLGMLAAKWVLVFGGGICGALAHVLVGGGSGVLFRVDDPAVSVSASPASGLGSPTRDAREETLAAALAQSTGSDADSAPRPFQEVLDRAVEVTEPAPWAETRGDGPHELTGPRFTPDQPVTPAGDAPEGDDDGRPKRRPR